MQIRSLSVLKDLDHAVGNDDCRMGAIMVTSLTIINQEYFVQKEQEVAIVVKTRR